MKIAYATGSRADYGIVRRYLKMLNNATDLSILVTGSHLEEKFGNSVDNIEADGFKIGLRVPLHINNATTAGVISSMSVALEAYGKYFEDNKYDLLIILGDRYEMMAVAIAAAMQRIPILHLHGGEATFGNYDEFIRHSITKMSTYHFASTEVYRKRIIQLGEEPNRVFNMGALGAENCRLIDADNVEEAVKNLPVKKYFVVAFHPETLSSVSVLEQIDTIIKVVDLHADSEFVFMGTNADTGSDAIRDKWVNYAKKHENTHYFENLNNDSYLYMVKNSLAIIGNSSSGIIEAPSLGVCTVNIGHRQDGRVCGNSVFNVECIESQIENAVQRVESFSSNDIENPYYMPDTAERYFEKTIELLHNPTNTVKVFYDIK
ncbi:MAG: UDP-N-acetylglucosamine 2-epimerase (hydrolyzing) [Lachnospiraceae bacterium]|nr:UDP-N-acetylglucosamine 2-epimerase (hydrolyzing) [Lachnospiraceae bacterium]